MRRNRDHNNQPDRHWARVTASAVHTDAMGGYSPSEHARALDRILADLEVIGEQPHHPELKLTGCMRSFFGRGDTAPADAQTEHGAEADFRIA